MVCGEENQIVTVRSCKPLCSTIIYVFPLFAVSLSAIGQRLQCTEG